MAPASLISACMATAAGTPSLHQGLRHTGKDRTAGGQRALAGVEVGQAHGWMVAQQFGQVFAAHQLGTPAAVLQRQAAGLARFVEDAVADEVQDVHRLAQQALLESVEGGACQPLQHELPVVHQAGQRILDRLPLPFHVQRSQAGRAGEQRRARAGAAPPAALSGSGAGRGSAGWATVRPGRGSGAGQGRREVSQGSRARSAASSSKRSRRRRPVRSSS